MFTGCILLSISYNTFSCKDKGPFRNQYWGGGGISIFIADVEWEVFSLNLVDGHLFKDIVLFFSVNFKCLFKKKKHSWKNWYSYLKITFSKILEIAGKSEIGL